MKKLLLISIFSISALQAMDKEKKETDNTFSNATTAAAAITIGGTYLANAAIICGPLPIILPAAGTVATIFGATYAAAYGAKGVKKAYDNYQSYRSKTLNNINKNV